MHYIEIKGHAAAGDVTLSSTEWQTAHRMREEIFIDAVDHALDNPTLWIIQDPVGKGLQPVEKVVEYQIACAQLRAVTEAAEG